jgi:hypothetical protein
MHVVAAPTRALAAGPVACARTTDPSTPATPSPGHPCWTDVTPYPFGSDGNEVDPSSGICGPPNQLVPGTQFYNGDWLGNNTCYLRVTSMAFRAWNRGLAAVTTQSGANTPFGVWLFNGSRWYPDPTFPGSATCSGGRVLWAGKLDYWLVGATPWGRLCRFDGVSLQWEPLPIPKAAIAQVPLEVSKQHPAGVLEGRGITTGACFAWDDCWFFGDFGVVLHWDGQALSDGSTGPVKSPWLAGGFNAAVARTDPAGHRFGFAVTDSGGSDQGQQLPARPDGTPPPQLFGSNGGPFSPLAFSPPTAPIPGDPYRTDLVAVDFALQGGGWVAGNPVGVTVNVTPGSRTLRTSQPAPLTRLDAAGDPVSCPGYDQSTFTFEPADGSESYVWSSLAAVPGTGAAVAGGTVRRPLAAPPLPLTQPGDGDAALVSVDCGKTPSVTRFVIPDPFDPDQAHAALVPANNRAAATALAADVANDAWAATTSGLLSRVVDANRQDYFQRPHMYRLTDGQPPLTAAGDDYEPRPSIFKLDPPVYQVLPPPSPVITPVTTTTTTTTTHVVHKPGKPAIYGVKAKSHRSRKGAFTLVITFKVRAPVTIGAQALRRGKVVSSTGLKRFRPTHGELVLRLDPKHWPTKIKFVFPKAVKRAGTELPSANVAADLQPIAAG